MAKGLLVVYTGASGVGKGTIMEKLLADNKNLKLSVSATTRAPRPGEVDGVNYHYITKDEFNNMIDNDLLLEHATYCGNMYGTPKAAVLELLEKGFDVMLEIEVKGYEQVKRLYPESSAYLQRGQNFSSHIQRRNIQLQRFEKRAY